jgi:hypothetical protein
LRIRNCAQDNLFNLFRQITHPAFASNQVTMSLDS